MFKKIRLLQAKALLPLLLLTPHLPTVSSASAAECVTPPSGLISWYRAEGNANDSTGTNNAAYIGSATNAPGMVGTGWSFNGTNGYIRAAASKSFYPTNGLTIEGWIKPGRIEPAQPLVEWNGGTDEAQLWIEAGPGPGTLFANLKDTNGVSHVISTVGGVITTNTFQHVAVTYDPVTGVARLFRNGAQVTQSTLGSFVPKTSGILYFGSRGGALYKGLMDEMSIYSRPLTSNELQAIYIADTAGKCSSTAPAATYDLSRDYSTNRNPNGPWTYGWKTNITGPFNTFIYSNRIAGGAGIVYEQWARFSNNQSAITRNGGTNTIISNGGEFVAPPGTVWINPGVDGAVDNFGGVRFVTPSGQGGSYQVTANAESLLVGSSSGDTDLHIALNGVEIFSRFVAPSTNGTNRVSYSQPLTLQGGDVLEFLVGRGADNMVAGSGLKLAIQIGKSPVSQVYNLSRDYSLASNPNGAWSYGWKTNVGGVFRNFGFSNHLDYANGIIYDQWARYQNNQSAITRNSGTNTAYSDFGQFEAPPGSVWVNPGLNGADDNFAGARFTVPAGQGGNYQVGALVESLLVGYLSGDTDFHVVRNGTEVFGQFIPASTNQANRVAYTNAFALAAGDTVDFLVGRGADGSVAGSGLKLQIQLEKVGTIVVPITVVINPNGGLFTNSVDVQLTATSSNVVIRYTTNNTAPTSNSMVYSSAIRLTAAATIQAQGFSNNVPITAVATATFSRVYAVNDGIPAIWREQYFGPGYLTDPRVAANADPDGDGATNYQEYIAGTDPTNPNSVFRVTVRAVPLLSFPTVASRDYVILRRPSATSTNTVAISAPIRALGTNLTFVDTNPVSGGVYAVEILPPSSPSPAP